MTSRLDVPTIDFVRLSWTATALGASFARYEFQRSDDGGTTWADIATVTAEAIVLYDDFESLLDVQSSYRMRVVRTDGAYSAWTATVTATPVSLGVEYAFTSNQDSTLNTAYARDQETVFEDLNASQTVFQPLYGEDGWAVFHPTEDRYVRFPATLTLSAGERPGAQGIAAFDAIRAICNADLPYVCVRDQYGNRWFASVQCPSPRHRLPSAIYTAELVVTEITRTPTVAQIDS